MRIGTVLKTALLGSNALPENNAVPLGWMLIVDETLRKRKAACSAAFRWHGLRSIGSLSRSACEVAMA
ncbi:MAG: hypothetical protein ACK5OB_00360 [Pirellula sp.]